jgi:hypothetical protein
VARQEALISAEWQWLRRVRMAATAAAGSCSKQVGASHVLAAELIDSRYDMASQQVAVVLAELRLSLALHACASLTGNCRQIIKNTVVLLV